MADIIENNDAPDQGAIDAKAELAQHMAVALNGGMPSAITEPAAQQEPAPIVSVDPFTPFKELGYDTPEALIRDIADYRNIKANPAPPPAFKFENEASERIFKAIQAGKTEEVRSHLDQEYRIDRLVNVDMTPEIASDVVKLGMQLKYKDLTSKEIDYRFNKQFGLPAKPVQTSTEDTDEYQERVNNWQAIVEDKQMELMIEAKLAKPELQATKQKLVFPDIQQPQDNAYLQWKSTMEEGDKLAAQTTEAYKALLPKQLETKLNFNDEANKIAFEFQYEPDQEGFNKAIAMVSDIDQFYGHFISPDGIPDRVGFAKAIYFAINRDKVLMEAMKQSKNATIKASLPDNSQNGGLIRQMVTGPEEPSEIDKQMALRGIRK